MKHKTCYTGNEYCAVKKIIGLVLAIMMLSVSFALAEDLSG